MKLIKDLLSRVMTFCRLETAIVQYLEELEKRVYAVEEKQKLDSAAISRNTEDIGKIRVMVRQKVSV